MAGGRAARGWSQGKLATRAGLARETVARLEAGGRPPIADTVFRLEAALDLLPGELVPAWPEWAPISLATWGARSRERRRALGLGLAEVAAAAGVSDSTLSRFEREIGRSTLLETVAGDMGGGPVTLPRASFSHALGFADPAAHAAFCLDP